MYKTLSVPKYTKCTKSSKLTKNDAYCTALNTDPIIGVPNATGVSNVTTVPIVPQITKNDPSVPIKKLLDVPVKRLPTHLVYQPVYQT